jgi:hypothetical protein
MQPLAMSLSLNCLVFGDEEDKVFTVEVEKTKNVSILKKLIKEEKAPHLDHVAASDLDLWMVDLGPGPVRVNLDNYPKLSPPRKKLSLVFDDTVDDQRLHIIVKAPGTSH